MNKTPEASGEYLTFKTSITQCKDNYILLWSSNPNSNINIGLKQPISTKQSYLSVVYQCCADPAF